MLQQPEVFTAPGVVDAVAAHLQVVLPRVELIAAQRREAERQLERLLEVLETETPPVGDQREHSDVAIVRSMPGVGTRVAARMLAEGSQPLVDRAYHALRAIMGIAPVTKQSGASSHRLDAICLQCVGCATPPITGHEPVRSKMPGAARITRRFARADTVTGELCAASRIGCFGFS